MILNLLEPWPLDFGNTAAWRAYKQDILYCTLYIIQKTSPGPPKWCFKGVHRLRNCCTKLTWDIHSAIKMIETLYVWVSYLGRVQSFHISRYNFTYRLRSISQLLFVSNCKRTTASCETNRNATEAIIKGAHNLYSCKIWSSFQCLWYLFVSLYYYVICIYYLFID